MVPLKRPPISASGALPEAALVLVDVDTGEGITGHSYLAAYGKAMLKPLVSTTEALAEMIKGDALVPYEIDAKLRKRFTLFDTPGLVGLALAGIDMAAWDAYAKDSSATGCALVDRSKRCVRTTAAVCGSRIRRCSQMKQRNCFRRAATTR
jgi:mandelate racemase